MASLGEGEGMIKAMLVLGEERLREEKYPCSKNIYTMIPFMSKHKLQHQRGKYLKISATKV